MKIILKRLFEASADYYLMKETGECRNGTAAAIKDEMAAALVDAQLFMRGNVPGAITSGECSVVFEKTHIVGARADKYGQVLQKLDRAATRRKESIFSNLLKGTFTYGKKPAR